MTSALSRSDTRTKNRSLQIANDALYPSYGESWRDEIDVGPQDPEPGDLLFNEEELSPGVNQLGFEWLVKQLQINPEIAGGILLPGETPEGGKGGLGSMNKDQLERWIKENGITGPGADKIRNKWKNLGPNLPLAQGPESGLMIAGNPYGYSDEYMHRSKALREIIDGRGYDPNTVIEAQRKWIELQETGDIWKRVDAGGGDQNVASVDYGKEMPQNYRDWSEFHKKNYEEKAPGWFDRMKDHTKNYPTA